MRASRNPKQAAASMPNRALDWPARSLAISFFVLPSKEIGKAALAQKIGKQATMAKIKNTQNAVLSNGEEGRRVDNSVARIGLDFTPLQITRKS